MSLDSFRVRKGLIVDGGSTTTGSATVNGSLILTGSTSGQINLTAPAVAGSQAYTLPTALPAVNNYVLTGQTDGTLGWAAGSSVTTTYTIDAASTTGGANFNLTGSDASVDTIKFASGTNVTVTATDANTITIASTDTNTTYNISASTTTGGANLNLNGSDSSVDSVKYASGTGVTVSSPDANTIGIAIGQSVGTTDTVTFNTVNANLTGNVTGTVSSLSNHTTTDLAEGTNLYYTDARARAALSGGTGVTYNSTTGQISIGQDVATTATVTFNTVNANLTGNVTGTVSSLSNHTTTDLAEGTNLYYTDARARAALSAGTGISYNNTTGVISSTITQYTDAMARAALSATTSGDGSLVYNSSTGVFAYTGPSATNYRASLSGGTGVTYNSSTGVIAIGQDVATTANVTFASVTTPTLKAADGTTALTLANTTGDVTANRYIQVNGNRILNSSGNPTFYLNTTGDASVANTLTILGNTIKGWTGSASVTALTLNASGDVTFASRMLSTASKTITNGSNRATSYASVTGATAEDILIAGIGASGMPVNGLLVTNADLPSGSTSGRRPGILIRGYGGSEYNGVPASTPPQPYFNVEASRGTAAEPRAMNNGQPMGSFAGFTNAGSDLTSGNTPYWTAQQYPTNPAFGMRTFQNHRGPYSSSVANAVFDATISGSTLTVSAMTSGTILLGQELKLVTGNFTTTTNAFQIIAQTSGTTGGAGTYTLNAAPGNIGVTTSMFTFNTTLGSGFFINAVPNDTVITSASRVVSQITPDLIQFRAQSTGTATNVYEFRGWATTNYGGTGATFQQGTNALYLGISSATTTVGNTLSVQQTIKTAASTLQLQTSGGVGLTGNNIDYNRVYGQWQYDATVTPAASNTAYAYPIAGASGSTDYANIASVGSTSHIIPGALGMYKLQFSVQVANADNGSEHTAYFWWRKNGTDVPSSMGRITCPKGGQTIGGWDNMIQVTNLTDYWELMYATDDAANITLPYYGTTAFGPATASMFITLVPVGA